MKKLFLITLSSMFMFVACKKEDMSKYATKEDLANLATKDEVKEDSKADVYEFTLTFGPNVTWGFAPTIYKENPNDIVLTFINYDYIGNDPTWTQCPLTIGNFSIIPEFVNYSLIINIVRSDGGSGSPFTTSRSYQFKAVVIPVKKFEENPDIDYSNYDSVKKVFNLK